MRILHIENDSTVAKAAQSMLDGVVETYERTALGENAVKMAAAAHYDLILMEILLPDIDGPEVVRRLRANRVLAPLVLLSWLVDDRGVFDPAALGANDALAKPFTRESLVTCIRSATTKSGLSYPQQSDAAETGADRLVDGKERRRHRRFKTDRPARIAQGPGIDCRIVDLSHGGAGIQLLADHFDLPTSFQIVLGQDTRYTCRVCWRQGRRLGVKFLGRG